MVLARNLTRAVGSVRSFGKVQWTLDDWERMIDRGMSGAPTAAGENISPDGALSIVALYACVRVIADAVASLPFITYRRLDEGKERAPDHRLYDILHDQPNPEMTAFQMRQAQVGHLLTWGNSYSEIEESDAGVKAVWPLRPDMMTVRRNSRLELEYEYRKADGSAVIYPFRAIHHVAGYGFNGLTGHSPVYLAREALGAAVAVERYGASYFGNGARPAGVLKHPNRLKEDTAARIKARWESMHAGQRNAHRIAVLEEGVDYQSIGIPPEDSQFLETRKFHAAEIASIYRVPPHMIGQVDRSTSWGSGIEQQSIGFVTYVLMPYLVLIEQATLRDLFRIGAGKRTHFAQFLVDALLRGDAQSRAAALAVLRQNGVINADEWRALENMNPIPGGGGKVFMVNGNMIPAEDVGKEPEPPPAPPAIETMPEMEPATTGGSNGGASNGRSH